MTRDDRRAQCIEAQIAAFLHDLKRSRVRLILMDKDMETAAMVDEIMIATRTAMAAAFDALPTAGARVVPIEATEEMIRATEAVRIKYGGYLWRAMAATGDLTNPPEEKP